MTVRQPLPFPIDDQDDDTPLPANFPAMQISSAWSVWEDILKVPALKAIAEKVRISAEPRYRPEAWAVIGTNGVIYANPLHLAPSREWAFVLAHLLAHLGLRHRPTNDPHQQLRDELAANVLTLQLAVGTLPKGFVIPPKVNYTYDAQAAHYETYEPSEYHRVQVKDDWLTPAGLRTSDLIAVNDDDPPADMWGLLLTRGLLENIGGMGLGEWSTIDSTRTRNALRWFMVKFPLLSSLAAHFDIIEDRDMIKAFDISIAAVVADRMEIYINPDAELTAAELRFIIGHELMHVGLLHHKRQEDRDHLIWNLACDFVINAWLIEMGVGEMPPRGGLYNPKYQGLSANEIYELLLKDPNYVKTLVTFRGMGIGDIMPPGTGGNIRLINGKPAGDVAAELFKDGLKKHMDQRQGLLPAGLLEMISPVYSPPPAWKISLTRWFEAHFEPTTPARSYARQSRRQQATPDIPRPRYAMPQLPDGSGVFGVVLDTSGSMDNALLGKGLGAIVSLAEKHHIKQVRLIFCDATPYDEGFVPVKRLSQPIHVRGRGGTRLQPGIDLIQAAKDFPKDAPVLVITDGACDVLTIKVNHAFLLPEGRKLPFTPIGPVFTLK